MSTPSQTSHLDEAGPPAADSSVNIHREEISRSGSRSSSNDEAMGNLSGTMESDPPRLNTRRRDLRIATWNVRTMHSAGKLHNIEQEIRALSLDVLGVSEVRWTEAGEVSRENYKFLYSGGDSHVHGVGMFLATSVSECLSGFWPISDRVMLVKLNAKPFNLSILQVYEPTTDHTDEEVEQFYDDIQMGIGQVKSDEVLVVMGDFNAKVGSTREDDIVGSYGLGTRNMRGTRLIEFCKANNLVVSNTWFKHPARRLYTWKSPGDICRNQID